MMYNILQSVGIIHSVMNAIKNYYTGGILQRLDTDVHSAVIAKTSTVL